MALRVEIITPEKTVFQGEVDSVSLPTPQGEITVLPHHIPVISIVVPGSIVIRKGNDEQLFAVSRGVIEIDGTSVRILADTADRAAELEEAAIEKAKADAEKLLKEKQHDVEGFAEATAILERELARLHVAKRHRSRRGTPHVDS
ncbi:ATP synthase F1 subunit epsilon [Candidatus Peregrinibacteria bacterium]|nr:ATP synthase F1 subunit epsilon [Candidatus Peregrinibacteria bacterium]